ncbi:MAG: DUF3297 family protein [Erythrobacter sp.]|nr:DUF3297 family protein [Erythrobacter sp.]NNC47201.1 DUF3297 family protein [Sphingomonas sp.]RZV52757.1 MAG: DUF3297 family protein [Sphingomonadaceae bacterium]
MSENEKAEFPDRLSMDPRSEHFNEELLQKGVGIRLNGVEKVNVEEYCISEGWIKIAMGKSRDRSGNPLLITAKGKVEPFWDESAGA